MPITLPQAASEKHGYSAFLVFLEDGGCVYPPNTMPPAHT